MSNEKRTLPHDPVAPREKWFMDERVGKTGGITKREYFASEALAGLLAGDTEGLLGPTSAASLAVERADALIEALNEIEEES